MRSAFLGLAFISCAFASLFSCFDFTTDISHPLRTVAADVTLRSPTEADLNTWNEIKHQRLVFEKEDRTFLQMTSDFLLQRDPYEKPRLRVKQALLEIHGGQELKLPTQNGEIVSALFFHRPHAVLTLVYATGYFANQTPTKEWIAPFVHIFKDCNILMFDWQGYGDSSGTFSRVARNNITALLSFCKSHEILSHLPTVLIGFCLGGALAIDVLVELQRNNPALVPDALSISCTMSHVKDIHLPGRIDTLASNKVMSAAIAIAPLKHYLIDALLDTEIQTLSPEEQLSNITIPCNFEYCVSHDYTAPLSDAYANYNAAYNAPMRHLILSHTACHVRLHKETPLQYRQAYLQFFKKAGLISDNCYQRMLALQLLPLQHNYKWS